MSVVVDDIVELVLERPAHGGYSVGRVDGQVVFVRLGIPGERVRARITALGSGGRFAYGEVDHVLEPSPDRVVPRCLHAVPGGCGGCDWQQATIARQRSMKAEIVREQLIRVGGFDPADPLLVDLRVEPCGDDPEGFGYRTRMDFVGDERGRLGLRRARSHDVIPLTACPLAVSEINASEAFHQPWGNGATIRVARTAQGVVVNPEEAAPITVSETVGDTRFDVVADGFWQVHRNAPVTFADIVRTMLEPRAGEFLVDAYGGVGLFAGMLGPILGPGGRTLLVEGDRTAARLAKRNLRTLQHVEVVSERVDRWLQTTRVRSVDLVVLDPPRSGAGPKVMSGLLSMSPRRMVYVACDPASLARDLAAARKAGYRLTALRAVDAFPQTAHVETFALLEPGAQEFGSFGSSPLRSPMTSKNSFGAERTLTVGSKSYTIYGIDAVEGSATLPFTHKVLLENLLRTEDGANVTADHIRALGSWDAAAEPTDEIQFTPARVIMQDFTGVPCVVDLATMREAVVALGGDASKINPLAPAELVIDHSVISDVFGRKDAFEQNTEIEYGRNKERYQFLRWGQTAFDEFKVVPPGTGIVHQVNIEHLARVVMVRDGKAYPDTVVGTDSHTTMVNGLGVLGWGVGGIEAEAAMLGQPVSMLIPRVVGFKLKGALPAGATATDLVLTITEMLRKHGVVGKFVEFFGEGVATVPLANRATIGNMSPEYGSTAAIFPIDGETLRYLELTGRSAEQLALVEAYAKAQGLWHDAAAADYVEPTYSEYLELDLGTIVPSIAGPKRPQDRVVLAESKAKFAEALPAYVGGSAATGPVDVVLDDGRATKIKHGDVVIASITSCTNTSNPSVMLGAGLLAKKAAEKGLTSKPWVKTTLAPGSQVVTDYYDKAGLTPYLEALGFHLVGYGCVTCIGNSGPLPEPISKAVNEHDVTVVSVLSGNRNFEGRINPDVKMNYLASPPLVIAYALAGTMDFDFESQPLGQDKAGNDVFLRDIWPTPAEVEATIDSAIGSTMYSERYAHVFEGDARWKSLDIPTGETFEWDAKSTYVRKPPYFDGMPKQPEPVRNISGARVLAKLGDSVTTDHISPAGSIKPETPAGQYLLAHGVAKQDFNSYGSRRGNHEVMIRGTFANIRLRNQLLDNVEGGFTRDFTQAGGPQAYIYDASMNYQSAGIPLVVLAGKEYGSGSSRDWAAKGTALLGVKAVIAESYERIHRSNLIGMGVLPLQFPTGTNAEQLGLSGTEEFAITGIDALNEGRTPKTVQVTATKDDGTSVAFDAVVRIDTPGEADYYRHGGILQYVLRSLI